MCLANIAQKRRERGHKSQLWIDFNPVGSGTRGIYASTKTCESMLFRSSYEKATMKHLDVDHNVAPPEHEKLRIPYAHDNHKRWYVPDFV